MTAMGYVIRPVASAAELAEVYDVMGAQFDPARTRGGRGFGELARLFPERRALMLLAQADDQIVGGAHIGPRGTLSIALIPEARGQGLGTRLVRALEEAATRLGCAAINVGGVTDRTRGFYLRLGFQGRGSMMRKGLPLSAFRRDPDGWHRELAALSSDAGRSRRIAQLWRPVRATVTPTPIMASPPAPPTISTRRGERANQLRTALAANPQQLSETAPMTTEISASTSICSGTCPAARCTNCGRIAPNRM